MRPFVPFSENDERKNLISLMAVSSDPGTYGQLRVLNIKSPEQIDGPALVDSVIKRKYAADFTLESQTGSKVRLGTLQAIPIGDSILWVRPWYVQAEQTPIPQLSFVVVAYGDQVVRARTLEGALKLAFPNANVDFTTTVGPLTPLGARTPGRRRRRGAGRPTTGRPARGRARPARRRRRRRRRPCRSCSTRPTSSIDAAKAALKADPPDFATYDANIAKAFQLVTQAEELAGGTPPSPTDTTASGVTDATAST